jgi:hypothetical protein
MSLQTLKAKLLRSARSEAHLKIANFKDFKNISELSQSLISEQYSQKSVWNIYNRLFTPQREDIPIKINLICVELG